jgi:hypothetical protein
MTEVEAQKLVTMLVTAFPSSMARLSQDQQAVTHQVYRRMLRDLESTAAAAAVERLMATSRFLPSISEIRAATLDMTAGEKRDGLDAWGDVKQAVKRIGRGRQPTFADSRVSFVMDCLGWVDFCDSDVGDEPSWRARFVELYNSATEADRRDLLTRDLPAVKRFGELREAEHRPKTLSEAIAKSLDEKEFDS